MSRAVRCQFVCFFKITKHLDALSKFDSMYLLAQKLDFNLALKASFEERMKIHLEWLERWLRG